MYDRDRDFRTYNDRRRINLDDDHYVPMGFRGAMGKSQTLRGSERMSCMEHECGTCDHFWGDNSIAKTCPQCGSTNVSNENDEQYSHDTLYFDDEESEVGDE